MSRILNITFKDLKIIFRDKMTYVWLFLTPMVMIFIFGFALGGSNESIKVSLPVIYEKSDPIASGIADKLELTDLVKVVKTETEESARRGVEDGDFAAALLIPEGLASSVEKGDAVYLKVLAIDTNDARVQMAVQAAYQASFMQLEMAAPQQYTQKLSVETKKVEQVRSSNAFDIYVPGYAVMFMLFAVMQGLLLIIEEKETGTLKRLFLSPSGKLGILSGKQLAVMLTTMIQAAVLFSAGWLLFGISVDKGPLSIALICFCTGVAAIGLGTMLSGFIKEVRQVSGIVVFIILVMSALGGSWWPIWIMPGWLQSLSWITINGWAMDAFNKIMIYNKGFTSILPQCAVLGGMGMLFFAIGVRSFKYPE